MHSLRFKNRLCAHSSGKTWQTDEAIDLLLTLYIESGMAYRFSDILDIGKYRFCPNIGYWLIESNSKYRISAEAKISDIEYQLQFNRYAIPALNLNPG